MRKVLSKILVFIIMINTIFSGNLLNIFAKDAKKNDLKLKWNKTLALSDSLEEITRPENSDEVFLSWEFGKQNGASVDNGTYTLKYYIADNKEIEFKIVKTGDNAKITYKVNGNNTVNNSNKLEVYKASDKAYKPANKTNFPDTDPNFCLTDFYQKGDASAVSFKISKGKGFSFRYNGNTVKFIWKNDLFYFSTNGIQQGNIYGFDLELKNNNTIKDTLKVFTGINKNTFTSKPIANSGKGENIQNPVDQSKARPITDIVGDKPELDISFEVPKEYNSNTKKFEHIKPSSANVADKATKVVLDLGNLDNTKALQITIEDIYITNLAEQNNIKVPASINATATRSQDNSRITIKLKNEDGTPEKDLKIVPGIIYDPVKISAVRTSTKPEYSVESLPTTIPIGKVYTYPKYSITSLGLKEFYINFTPFKGYNGYYTIKQGSAILEKWAEHEEKNKGAEDVMIAVPISLEAGVSPEKYFQIEFKFAPSQDSPEETTTLNSQVLKYKAFESDIMLSAPENLKITESDIVRNIDEDTGKITDNLFVTFVWDLGYEDVFKGLIKNNAGNPVDVKYTFYKGEKPNDTKEEDFIAVKLNASANGQYTLAEATKANGNKYTGEFISGEVKDRTETIAGKETKILQAEAKFKIPVSEKNSQDKLQLQYPNIYFISAKGSYTITTNGKPQSFETGKSLQATLTLNGLLNIELIIPQNIKIVDKSVKTNEFKVSFDTLNYKNEKDILNQYFEKMIKRNDLDFNEKSIKYNLYITHDKALLDELIKYDESGKDKHNKIPTNLKEKIKTYDYKSELIGGKSINVKTESIDDKTKIIDSLRANNIVKISDMTQSKDTSQIVTFEGLDENQIYYIIAETIAEPVKNGNVYEPKKDISKYSTMVTVTTLKDADPPQDNEKVPSAPTNFNSKNTTLNSTNLVWDRIVEVPEPNKNSTLEYEFIRIRGEALKDEILKTKYSYDKTWEKLKDVKNKGGFKTNGQNILEYKNNSFSAASQDSYVYESYTGTQGNILDKTLSPNQVYYYYIRTVRIIDGKSVAYSVWVPLAVTTKNVEGPKNLRVERNAQYDKKSEVVISFDIPKMNTDLIGKEYEIQYSIKKDPGNWEADKTMPKSELNFKESDDGKTIRVTYKIKGLSSGSMYTIRVRLLNKPMNSASMYSNEVDHRTDGDNQDNDYDSNVDEWKNNFNDLVEKLKKEPYWYIKDTISETTVVYRPGYFDNLISSTTGSLIELANGIGGTTKEYYIPASSILKAFEQNKGFKTSYNDIDAIFSAKSISPTQNDAIKALEARRKTDQLADYFVKLIIDFKNVKYTIEGNQNITPIVDIRMEVIGTNIEITEWDANALAYIDELLKLPKYSTNLKEYIKRLLKEKKDSLFIGQEINKYFKDFKMDFGKKLENNMKSIRRRVFQSGSLNQNIIIAYPFESGIIAKGYKLILGRWAAVSLYDYAGKKAISTTELGSYTFTASKLVINGISNLPNGVTIIEIINKYGLDDYLGKGGNINLKANLTKHMAIGSLARIAGNTKTQDPVDFLKSKGITVSSRNSNDNISSQEAVYITMKVYELRSNKKIDTIKIRNYNKTSGIKGINNKYKKAIQVAFELGIYNNENMNPNGAMTIQEFLQMLANLSSKVTI